MDEETAKGHEGTGWERRFRKGKLGFGLFWSKASTSVFLKVPRVF